MSLIGSAMIDDNNRLDRLLLSYGAGIFGKKQTNVSDDKTKRKRLFFIGVILACFLLLAVLFGLLFGLHVFTNTNSKSQGLHSVNNA